MALLAADGAVLVVGLAHLYQGWGGVLDTALIGVLMAGLYFASGSDPTLVWRLADAAVAVELAPGQGRGAATAALLDSEEFDLSRTSHEP